MNANFETGAAHEIEIHRLLSAPRDLVWKVWTQAQHIDRWWGPNGFSNTTLELDVRPGGLWRFVMHSPDGVDSPDTFVFVEVVPPERLTLRHGDHPDNPTPFYIIVSFDEQNGHTRLSMRMRFENAHDREKMIGFGAVEGARSTLDSLDGYLAQLPPSL